MCGFSHFGLFDEDKHFQNITYVSYFWPNCGSGHSLKGRKLADLTVINKSTSNIEAYKQM